MIQMNLTPQILTANIVFYNLEPITLCIQENCVTKKMLRELTGIKVRYINHNPQLTLQLK